MMSDEKVCQNTPGFASMHEETTRDARTNTPCWAWILIKNGFDHTGCVQTRIGVALSFETSLLNLTQWHKVTFRAKDGEVREAEPEVVKGRDVMQRAR